MPMFEIKMPKLGESITEGTIMSWAVKVGDKVQEGDVLFEVNTAKVSAEIPSPVAGTVTKILFEEGSTIAVGVVVALIALEGFEEVVEIQKDEIPAEIKEENRRKDIVEKTKPLEDERWYSPVVLSKAEAAGISREKLSTIPGSGYQGRLTKRDIEVFLEGKSDAQVQPVKKTMPVNEIIKEKAVPDVNPATVDEVLIPMDPVRRIIADRMLASKKISPHVTNVIEVDVTKLVVWRDKNKEEFRKRTNINLTYMPIVAEAVVHALQYYPRVNSSVNGYTIVEKKQINLGIAVSLNDGNLIVPVIKNADKLNLNGMASAIAVLAEKARSNKLGPDEIQGGTFTITNFGSFKSLFGTPIINQPETAILGLGMIEKKPSVLETPEGDVIAIRWKMYLSLSYDHRVIDGVLGGNFLRSIADYLENKEYINF